MRWNRQRVDTAVEKNIITGMIISNRFIKEVIPILKIDLFNAPFARTVAEWCLKHFEKYGEAPNATIQDIYESYNEGGRIEETQSQLISAFLTNLSAECEQMESFNVPYMLDQAEQYFRTRSLQSLVRDINTTLSQGNVEEAEAVVAGYRRVVRPKTKGIDILRDTEAMREALDTELDILITLPGRLGKQVGPLGRDDFLMVIAPAKRGKTFWLEMIGLVGMFAGLKVLWISLEMSHNQILRRLAQTFLGETNYPKEVSIPEFDCELNRENTCTKDERRCWAPPNDPDYVKCTVCANRYRSDYVSCVTHRKVKKQGVDSTRAVKKLESLQKIVRSGRFHLVSFPARSVTVSDLRVYSDNLKYYDNFISDMTVIDYPTLIEPESRGEYRHRLNDVWERIRGWGQEEHTLMVGSHHSNKQTFGRKTRQGDLSEDTRLLNHVTTALALNQTPEEKHDGVMKVGVLGQRHDDFDLTQEITVLQCLAIGKPYLDSY